MISWRKMNQVLSTNLERRNYGALLEEVAVAQQQKDVSSTPALPYKNQRNVTDPKGKNAASREETKYANSDDEDGDFSECDCAEAEEDFKAAEKAIGCFVVKSTSIDEAVELIGYGNFQRVALIACGLCFIADAMELTLLGFLAVVLQYEWNLSDAQTATISAAVFVGEGVGALALGSMGDRFGRKPAFLTASIIICIGGIATCFTKSYEQLVLVRFIVGFGVGGIIVPYDIFAEFLPKDVRGQSLMLVNYFWTFGSVLVTVFAYATLGIGLSWRWFVFLCCIPCFLSAGLCLKFVPESPRWLVTKERRDEALQILHRASIFNGRMEVSQQFLPGNMILRKGITEASSCAELIKPHNRRVNFLLWGVWMAFGFSTYGTVLLITSIFERQGDVDAPLNSSGPDFHYSAIAFSALSESFGVFVALLTVDSLGRIKSQIASYSLAGIAGIGLCIASSFNDWSGRVIVLTMLAFFARAMELMSNCLTWMTTAEVLKTEIRATGHSAASFAARIGAFFTSYAVEGHTTMFQIGLFMLAAHALAIFCVSQLPETKNKSLDYTPDPPCNEATRGKFEVILGQEMNCHCKTTSYFHINGQSKFRREQ